jgi:predicted transposase/invertase (TIGR01784 family)
MEEKRREIPPPQPLNDFMFSLSFQDMRAAPAALSLINAILGNVGRPLIDGIEDLTCQDVILGLRQETRGCRLDVVARSKGRFVNVEVQLDPMRSMVDRMLFNAAQALVRETGSGAKFEALPRVTVISLLDFYVRKESEDIHQPLSVRWEKDPQTRATDLIDLHVIELKKVRKRLKTLTEALMAGEKNPFLMWMYYLVEGYQHPEDPFVQEVLDMDEGLRSFASQYHLNAGDPTVRQKYFDYQMALWAERDREETAREEGIAIGRDQGIAIGRDLEKFTQVHETARRGLRMGFSIEAIASLTDLPVSKIEAIRKEMN